MRNISIWEKNTEKRTYPSLSENINAEIAVIGAGLAGILTARRLKESGCDVVVIEKDNLGSGQTKNLPPKSHCSTVCFTMTLSKTSVKSTPDFMPRQICAPLKCTRK